MSVNVKRPSTATANLAINGSEFDFLAFVYTLTVFSERNELESDVMAVTLSPESKLFVFSLLSTFSGATGTGE